jgi:hypothetical protein
MGDDLQGCLVDESWGVSLGLQPATAPVERSDTCKPGSGPQQGRKAEAAQAGSRGGQRRQRPGRDAAS